MHHMLDFPKLAFLPLSSILDASPTVSSSIRARFCLMLILPPPLPFSLEAAMAPKPKNAASSKKPLRIHNCKRSESESAHLTDHEGGGEGEVEEEEETSPPPSHGATSRSKTQAKSPERRQPARGTKGATPAPYSSKPPVKRPRTAARAVNPILPPSELAKLAAARASPPPKNAPDSSLSIPLCCAEAETSLSHHFLEFCLPENFPQFMVLPGVNDASFGFPLTVLSPNDPTNLPSYDDANLRRYFKGLLSVRGAACAAPWESFEAGDRHTQPFAAHIVAFYPPIAAHRPPTFTTDHPAVLGQVENGPALPRHGHEPFAEFVPYVEGRLMVLDELRAAHTQYSEHRHVETDRRNCLYNDLFTEYTSTLGKWEARKVDVVAELDARERSRAKAVKSASEKKLIGATPQSRTRLTPVTAGARVGSSGSGGACLAPLPISCLDDDTQKDDLPEAKVDQLAPVVDNKKRRPAGEPMNWAVPSFPPDMSGRKSKSKTVPETERLLTHGWQWSQIAGMHRFAEGMETEGIALHWLPALFYFTRGPGCTLCHDHNWACVCYYDGPDLVAACVCCLEQCHTCTPVADFNFAYMDGRVLLLNHRLFEAIIRNNTWLFSEVLGSDMVDKLKELAIVMSDGNICLPMDHATVASIAKAAVACRPFLAAVQASDADSVKQVMGMLSELAHVFETTSNDLNSFLAMRNVRDAEQATFLMSPDERMDDPEDNRSASQVRVVGGRGEGGRGLGRVRRHRPIAAACCQLHRPAGASVLDEHLTRRAPRFVLIFPPPPKYLLRDTQDPHWHALPLFRTAWDGAWRWGLIVGRCAGRMRADCTAPHSPLSASAVTNSHAIENAARAVCHCPVDRLLAQDAGGAVASGRRERGGRGRVVGRMSCRLESWAGCFSFCFPKCSGA
ncbi:hypothetical protein B0H17DRAFT_1126874 [Mycena rosella]|uniref:Uncharacterized protein n=1 Tax=Mycena rosella TaxID=1033263 RepID=A0AAD7GSW2_MYCRO|nr:hypothetical protein B0H17DRAFT_1126874 [Mycena rosella]